MNSDAKQVNADETAPNSFVGLLLNVLMLALLIWVIRDLYSRGILRTLYDYRIWLLAIAVFWLKRTRRSVAAK